MTDFTTASMNPIARICDLNAQFTSAISEQKYDRVAVLARELDHAKQAELNRHSSLATGKGLTVTQLAAFLQEKTGIYFSPQSVNHMLITMELQIKTGDNYYVLTEGGVNCYFGIENPVGTQIRSIRWYEGIDEYIIGFFKLERKETV